MAKSSNSMEIEDIQRRMAQIRHDMHGEVLGAVMGARQVSNLPLNTRDTVIGETPMCFATSCMVTALRRRLGVLFIFTAYLGTGRSGYFNK